MYFPSIQLHRPSAISKGNRFTADSVRQTHGGLLCFRPRDTTSLYFFFFPFADLKDFVSPGHVLSLQCCNKRKSVKEKIAEGGGKGGRLLEGKEKEDL